MRLVRRGVFVGFIAATASIIGCGGAKDQTITTIVPPPSTATVTLRSFTLDGGALPRLSARARVADRLIDSAAARPDGSVVLVVPTSDSVDVRLITLDADSYYSSQARVRPSRDTTIDVVLVPAHWTVSKGAYQGSPQHIDLVAAFGSDADDTHFLNVYTQYRTMLVAWAQSSLPIPVGFDTTNLWRPLSTVDSAFIWRVTNDVNAIIGQTVFAPAGPVPFAPSGAIGIRLDTTYASSGESVLGTNLNRCPPSVRLCTAVQAEIWMHPYFSYPSVFTEANERMIAHELMHTLGFGHACYWPSVMMHTGGKCVNVNLVPTRPTATDVAYIELVMELARLLGEHPAAWHLSEAFAAAQ